MAKTKQEIIADLDSYMRQGGGGYRSWYVGVASDSRTRLFNDHQVKENGGSWIYCGAASSDSARAAEEYFLSLGCDGGPGGGDAQTKSVYAYKKEWYTKP